MNNICTRFVTRLNSSIPKRALSLTRNVHSNVESKVLPNHWENLSLKFKSIPPKKLALGTGLVLAAYNSYCVIPNGYIGLQTTFGEVNDFILPSGLHLKLPFSRITKFNVQLQRENFSIVTTSKEEKVIDFGATVHYRLSPENAYQIHKEVGRYYEYVILQPIVDSTLRDVAGHFSAKSFRTTSTRKVILERTKEELQERLSPYGVEIVDVFLTQKKETQESVYGFFTTVSRLLEKS